MAACCSQADWADGRITAGSQSAQVKRNLQLPQHLDIARELQAMVEAALKRNALFFSAALPKTVFPPVQLLSGRHGLWQSCGQCGAQPPL
jgi:predicted 2-oxoglutarate/Fe(II)-dependent dioxygenase YbiX